VRQHPESHEWIIVFSQHGPSEPAPPDSDFWVDVDDLTKKAKVWHGA
jgi:hypothetical protein